MYELETLPRSIQVLLVVVALLAVDLAFAAYLESAVAAQFGWPLLFLTAIAVVVVAIDGLRRGLARLLAR